MSRSDSLRAAPAPGSASKLIAVTPADGADLPEGLTKALYVGVGGVVAVMDRDGNVVEIQSNPGQYHPVSVRRVIATGTTASRIIALY